MLHNRSGDGGAWRSICSGAGSINISGKRVCAAFHEIWDEFRATLPQRASEKWSRAISHHYSYTCKWKYNSGATAISCAVKQLAPAVKVLANCAVSRPTLSVWKRNFCAHCQMMDGLRFQQQFNAYWALDFVFSELKIMSNLRMSLNMFWTQKFWPITKKCFQMKLALAHAK